MRLQEDNQPSQQTASFAGNYTIFQTLLATFGNAVFLWLCITMRRKAYPQAPEQLLVIGCVAASVLAVLAPVLWLWYKKQERQNGPMPPENFMRYIGTSIQASEAFVVLGLLLFFKGAPVSASATAPAAALAFDLLFLLPWAISDKKAWDNHRS